MANTTMTVTLKLAVKSTAEWAALGHAPAAGAPCVEITTTGETKLKIGNGTDLFPALKYVSGDTIGASTTNGNLVVNGSEVQVYNDKDCLKTDGYAGQLAKLFAFTSYDVVPDDATLNDLSPGIYRVKTSAARVSLGIPDTAVSTRPTNVSADDMRRPGGLLIKLGGVVSGPTYYLDIGNVPKTFTGLLPSAFFIEAHGGLYYAYSLAKQQRTQTGTITTYDWSWRYILSAYVDSTTPLHITSITYLNTDVTVAAGTTHLFYKTEPSAGNRYGIPLPYTGGTAYGPTASYTLTYDAAKGGLIYTAPSSGAVTLPAGQYLLALK